MSKQPLLLELLSGNASYAGRFAELRDQVGAWLEYVPATFPHYTRHTQSHSDEIIARISNILFDDRTGQPTVPLSDTEAYVLACSALLHDVGMVTSDFEKLQILESQEWKAWVTKEPYRRRWDAIAALRSEATSHGTAMERLHFVADVQLRFLIAEYVRAHHHTRSVDLLRLHPTTLGDYAFQDPLLQRTIEAVCVGHGLTPTSLKDDVRYPHRRDIRSDRVNVRFAAILLRLGDLLDMRCDRACPLLLSAASPVPADSMAHWSQYQRIVHQVIAPDRIELRAECATHDEHRVLHDWFSWIDTELKQAQSLMANAPRHGDWLPPRASISGDEPTLVVVPAENATYRPVDWTFQLDKKLVIERLTEDLYADRWAFLRELIQNSADATRCRLYLELERRSADLPVRCDLTPVDARDAHPIRVTYRREMRPHSLSGDLKATQVITVEDSGIGMDAEVIHDYFLQIGRSFYKSPAFRRRYPFQPTSRFGIGFLSVFSVSDYVEVETYNPDSPHKDGPLRLTLTGASNFILLERGARTTPGTRIAVHLREEADLREITDFLRATFVFLEFPLEIDRSEGGRDVLRAERGRQYETTQEEVPEGSKDSFAIRAFEVDKPDYYGTLYVFAHYGSEGERWDRHYWANSEYREANPSVDIPTVPGNALCFHGAILYDISRMLGRREGHSARIDYRGGAMAIDLARGRGRSTHLLTGDVDPIGNEWHAILDRHLAESTAADGPKGWLYRHQLMREFGLPEYWIHVPDTVRMWTGAEFKLCSVAHLQQTPTVEITVRPAREYNYAPWPWKDRYIPPPIHEPFSVLASDLRHWDTVALTALFRNRRPNTAVHVAGDHWSVCWVERDLNYRHPFPGYEGGRLYPVPFVGPGIIGFPAHNADVSYSSAVLLNSGHPFVQWLIRFCEWERSAEVSPRSETILKRLTEIIRYRQVGATLIRLNAYVRGLHGLGNLPAELHCETELREADVRFPWGAD